MPATMSKNAWLEEIERERQIWEELVAEASKGDLNRPGASGEWTFKDVAGHLNAWRRRTVARLETAASGGIRPPSQWPDNLDDETEEGTQAINNWFYEQYRDRSADEILEETRDQFRRMRAAVEAIPENDLLTPGRYRWLGDYPLSAVLYGSFEHLHEEHEPGIRAWLAE
jgi:hypothetical protein